MEHRQDSFTLGAVNHTSIATYSQRSLTLILGLRQTFHWIFIIANVKSPILGTDFLHNYSIIVDVKHNKLLDGLTQLRVQGISMDESSPSPSLLPKQASTPFKTILSQFPQVIRPCTGSHYIKHDITHHITTTGPPVSAHPRRLSPEN